MCIFCTQKRPHLKKPTFSLSQTAAAPSTCYWTSFWGRQSQLALLAGPHRSFAGPGAKSENEAPSTCIHNITSKGWPRAGSWRTNLHCNHTVVVAWLLSYGAWPSSPLRTLQSGIQGCSATHICPYGPSVTTESYDTPEHNRGTANPEWHCNPTCWVTVPLSLGARWNGRPGANWPFHPISGHPDH